MPGSPASTRGRQDFSILIVDDEEGMRLGLEKALSLEGYRVASVATGADARRRARGERFDCAFVDLKLPDLAGTDLLEDLRAAGASVVIITAFASVDTAVRAMKLGAVDYLQKPFDNQDIVALADRLCIGRGAERAPEQEATGDGFVTESAAMKHIVTTLRKVMDSEIPLLLQGESGTGKEMLARFVHQRSGRSGKPFVAINCAAIPPELLESELFGHEKGSYTGAHATVPGKFEAAGAGTIFLDEIGDMGQHLQTKLLRALEERSFEPVGSTRSIPLSARIIASTNADLSEMIREKRFRLDLYYRLKGVSVTIPPLRERREDIEPLVMLFLDVFRVRYRKPGVEISREALRFLRTYQWPGNVRELKNAVESAVLLSEQNRPLLSHDFLLEGTAEAALPELWKQEREAIIEVLKRTGYNRSVASRELGMSRKTLYNKMKRYSIK
ncbi:MAG TPA: sigma-54 dependent transcriptional regulator [Spirochaetia bacterium]|nr:sigma-54 dependent transcriptional regulator [Spirochaetia bacterium]